MSLKRLLAATAIAATAGCGDSTGPSGDGADPITSLPRQLTVAEQEVITRSTAFGLELMGRTAVRDTRPNVVLSPLSASMALGMTLNGATGPTFDAMRSTLGFDGMDQADINAGYGSLIELLTGLDPDVDLAIGNAVWANEGYPFHQTFFDAVSTAFDATVETRDFAAPTTLDAINGWAAEATNGRIPRVLNALDPSLVMLLMNAVSFDGAWTEAFDPAETSRGEFRVTNSRTVSVDMMNASNVDLPLGYGDGWAAVELPYGGGAWAMVVVVSSLDIRSLVADWTTADWAAVRASLSPQSVDLVSIPRFEVAYDAFLNPILSDMGMGVAFGPEADFSGLSPRGAELCIDFVRQKTFIEVDEAGTRAAAVTTVGIGPTSFTGLVADQPFFFAIHERLSGTLLFTGIVGDPTVKDSGPQEGSGNCH
jgi:serpin B